MKEVEVSAICRYVAISPCGEKAYKYWPSWKGCWIEVNLKDLNMDAITFFNNARFSEGKVHRGIFKIKVVED